MVLPNPVKGGEYIHVFTPEKVFVRGPEVLSIPFTIMPSTAVTIGFATGMVGLVLYTHISQVLQNKPTPEQFTNKAMADATGYDEGHISSVRTKLQDLGLLQIKRSGKSRDVVTMAFQKKYFQ